MIVQVVLTYTGPSAAETRMHFSAGTGVGISNGQVSIGQSVETTDDVFGTVTADLTGDVTGTVSSLSNHSTTNPLKVTINISLKQERELSQLQIMVEMVHWPMIVQVVS